MQEGNMGIPSCTCVDAESKGMVFRQAQVIGGSRIHEGEPTGRKSVPGICRNHIESGLQLCFEPWILRTSAVSLPFGESNLASLQLLRASAELFFRSLAIFD